MDIVLQLYVCDKFKLSLKCISIVNMICTANLQGNFEVKNTNKNRGYKGDCKLKYKSKWYNYVIRYLAGLATGYTELRNLGFPIS